MPIKTSVWTSCCESGFAQCFRDFGSRRLLQVHVWTINQKGSASLTVVGATAWEQAAARKITDLHKWFGNSSWILGVCEVLLAQPCVGLWAVREPRVSLSQLSSDVQGHGAVRSHSPGVSPLPSPLARGCLSLWTLNSTSTSMPGAIAGMLSTRKTETNLTFSTDHGNWLFYIS